MSVLAHGLEALKMTLAMGWEILWALVLGFLLSAVVQSIVRKEEMSRLLPDDRLRSIAVACGLGAASSSCSYAAVALARSMIRKGANFRAAMAFQFASTNLVMELGILLAVLMGWQFTLAEFAGGPLLIMFLVFFLRLTLTPALEDAARKQAERGIQGRMEGHASMDMSVQKGTLWQRLRSREARTAISHYYVMDWASLWLDIAGGLVIAGAIGTLVPKHFWQGFFLIDHPQLAKLWGPVVGPLVAVASFVCSVGNVPLAAVLWNSGISFGGVIAFLFADLIVLPILDIYRKYYGWKVGALLFAVFYVAMALSSLLIEYLFGWLHLVPLERHAKVVEAAFRWNYTTVLNILALAVSALLLLRFFRSGGMDMMRMMNSSGQEHSEHQMHQPHS